MMIQGYKRRLLLLPLSFALVLSGLTVAGGKALAAESARAGRSVDFNRGPLKVSANRRYLVHSDKTPFFYLGDTAWELFHRLNREEAERYLENRRQKGFTVIQAVVLAELDGLDAPNALGDKPLIANDPARLNEAYFKHVDYIVDKAAEKGIYIGMLPTWGDKVFKNSWGIGPVIFNPENARVYGRLIAERYKDRPNILWIVGGDRNGNGYEEVWRGMARGLREGDGGRHLITYHPGGGHSSSEWFHNEDWLDFNMLQSGHGRKDLPNYDMIGKDYNRSPVKPCFDGEPRYENHPVDWKPEKGWFDDFDVRQAAYWALFAGAHGHTYGCHDIWQMKAPGRQPISSARNHWYESLDLPGAWDMLHVRNLMESRPYLSRVPDREMVVDPGAGMAHVQATRGDGYLFVYIPTGNHVQIKMGKISGTKVRSWWYDPREGKARLIGVLVNRGARTFTPPGKPGRGNDWVLVLDDYGKRYPAPGSRAAQEG